MSILRIIYHNYRLLFVLSLIGYFSTSTTVAQNKKKSSEQDSIHVNAGFVLILKDTFYLPEDDTLIFLPPSTKYSLKQSPYFKSDKFYDSLQSKSAQTKVTRMLFSLLFKSSVENVSDTKPIIKAEDAFEPFKGKTIGNITVNKVPVLEGSVQDTIREAKTWYGKALNKVHIDTQTKILKQNIIFHSGEKVDPYQMADNERILRQLPTIRDAKIYLIPRIEDTDIVDVIVATQDVISLGASFDYNQVNNFSFDIYDRNIMGTTRDFQVSYYFNEHGVPKHGYGLQYRVPNFYGTFIRGTFLYEDTYFRKQISMDLVRNFFTPEIKYGGGFSVRRVSDFFRPITSIGVEIPYTANEASIWLGRSYQLEKRTNLILQSRYTSSEYVERPRVREDSNRFFINSDRYFLSASLVNRRYSKSKLIRGFGRTEDVPKGKLLSFTYAYDNNEFNNRDYWQIKLGYAEYFNAVGYISASSAIGAFKNKEHWEDGVASLNFNYFSPLIVSGKSSFRQFIYLNHLKGINRRSENAIAIEENFKNNSALRPLGDKRFSMAFESVYFAPWYFYGCKLSLYNRNSFNWLSDNEQFDYRKLFSSFGFGARILNESFVFPTIELNFTYYHSPSGFPNTRDLSLFNNYPGDFLEMQIGRPEILKF
jgi:hypothetical protein